MHCIRQYTIEKLRICDLTSLDLTRADKVSGTDIMYMGLRKPFSAPDTFSISPFSIS